MRMKTCRLVCAVLVACGVGGRAAATDYYVSTGGKDTNSGTSVSSPFKTVGKAAAVATAGDTVYLRKGTYKEAVSFSNDGTAANPVRFIGDSTGSVFGTTKGNIVIQKPGGTAVTVDAKYLELYNIRFNKSAVNVRWNAVTGGMMSNCLVFSGTGDGLQVVGATLAITGCKVYSNAGDGAEIGPSSTVTMSGCSVYKNKLRGVNITPVAGFGAPSSVVMSKCAVYNNTQHGVAVDGGEAYLYNNLVYKNKQSGVLVSASPGTALVSWNCTIARNTSDGVTQIGGSSTIKNAIVAFNSGYGLKRSGPAVMNHSNMVIYSNSSGAYSGTPAGTKELTSDPQFTSGSAYTIKATSPSIDNGASPGGLVTDDYAGTSRPQGLVHDCGAYEGPGADLFVDVSSSAGFNLVTTASDSDGSGLHWADVNGDGWLDCLITGSSPRLLVNHSGAVFSSSVLGGARRQGAWIDADSDGDPDFFAACTSDSNSEVLWLNDAGAFASAGNAGMASPTGNEAAAAADVDGDGWLDLVMFGANGNWTGINQRSAMPAFAASKPAGLNAGGSVGDGDYCSSADVNEDGYPDFLYHFGGGKLFLSNGDGAYSLSGDAGISFTTGGSKKIGSAFADFDNDGRVDLFVPRYDSDNTGTLWKNDAGVFEDIAEDAGLIASTDGQRGCAWGDVNNDGYVDLYICSRGGDNQLYLNNGDSTFTLVDAGAGVTGNFQDCCLVDFDNDGDLDLSITRQDGANVLLRNLLNDPNYLKVRVVGAGVRATNTLGVGVRVELWDAAGAELLQRRDIGAARGFGGSEPLWAHFGGVDPAATYRVRAFFRTGTIEAAVVPGAVSSLIGSTTVPQMVTIEEPVTALRVTGWREVEAE